MYQYIYIQGKKYYFQGNYNNYQTALKQAKYYRKKNKCRYFIIKKDEYYKLYTNKVYKLW